MALHDLTPQLRTRLSRLERAVGWFVMLAVAALTFGFGYYLYNTAERKGWFKTKARYFTFVQTASGLNVGDPVHLMGFPVGRITEIESQPPYDPYNVYLEFEVQSPYYGYLWTEGSVASIEDAGWLGARALEVTKGTNGYPTYVFYPMRIMSIDEARRLPDPGRWAYGQEVWLSNPARRVVRPLQRMTNINEVAAAGISNIVALDPAEERKQMTGIWNDQEGRYDPYVRGKSKYWLLANEQPAITDRLQELVTETQRSLPGVLALTNGIALALSNASIMMSNASILTTSLNEVAVAARPAVSNLAAVTAQLDKPGALGEWLIPTNLNTRLDDTLGNAASVMHTANTNLAILAGELTKSLENLASITSNLNAQVEANTNLLSVISKTIVDADNFVQGLKRHWLLRSAFKQKPPPDKSSPPSDPQDVLRSPKDTP